MIKKTKAKLQKVAWLFSFLFFIFNEPEKKVQVIAESVFPAGKGAFFFRESIPFPIRSGEKFFDASFIDLIRIEHLAKILYGKEFFFFKFRNIRIFFEHAQNKFDTGIGFFNRNIFSERKSRTEKEIKIHLAGAEGLRDHRKCNSRIGRKN